MSFSFLSTWHCSIPFYFTITLSFTSFTNAGTSYRYDVEKNVSTVYKKSEFKINSDDFVTKQEAFQDALSEVFVGLINTLWSLLINFVWELNLSGT